MVQKIVSSFIHGPIAGYTLSHGRLGRIAQKSVTDLQYIIYQWPIAGKCTYLFQIGANR